jgi:hypothetical protein
MILLERRGCNNQFGRAPPDRPSSRYFGYWIRPAIAGEAVHFGHLPWDAHALREDNYLCLTHSPEH